jgi:hypothetical protein
MGIVLNKESSLEREWTTLNVAGMPARLIGPASVITAYKPSSYSGEYQYSVAFDVEALEPLSALEVRFLTFDVWGDKGRSLSMTMVEDFPVGKKNLHGAWRVFSENEAEEYYASVAYIARVRTKSGRVAVADPDAVVREVKKFSDKFTAADLAPQPTAVPTPAPTKE